MAAALSGAPPCERAVDQGAGGVLAAQRFGQDDLDLAVVDGAPDAVRAEHAASRPRPRRRLGCPYAASQAVHVAGRELALAPERAQHLVAVGVARASSAVMTPLATIAATSEWSASAG